MLTRHLSACYESVNNLKCSVSTFICIFLVLCVLFDVPQPGRRYLRRDQGPQSGSGSLTSLLIQAVPLFPRSAALPSGIAGQPEGSGPLDPEKNLLWDLDTRAYKTQHVKSTQTDPRPSSPNSWGLFCLIRSFSCLQSDDIAQHK